jgi:hypothetical protein
MDGAHDDTLTCLAMGLFVMQFSFNKIQEVKKRDAVMLQAWTSSAQTYNQQQSTNYNNSISIAPSRNMPIYTSNTIQQAANKGGNYMWLFAKTR